MRKASLGILLVALLLLVTACGDAASTSTGTQNANAAVKDQGTEANANEEQTGEAVAEEPAKEPEAPKEVTYKTGDKFKLGDWEVVLDLLNSIKKSVMITYLLVQMRAISF